MTYRKLLEEISRMNESQLDSGVVIWNSELDEYFPAKEIDVIGRKPAMELDGGHPYLVLGELPVGWIGDSYESYYYGKDYWSELSRREGE